MSNTTHGNTFYTVYRSVWGTYGIVWRRKQTAYVIQRIFLPESEAALKCKITRVFPNAVQRRSAPYKNFIAPHLDLCSNLTGCSAYGYCDVSLMTPFGKKVLSRTRTIKPGAVVTYGMLARLIHSPAAVRAVGNALAQNPFPFVIPCHRVVRSNGSIGGFQGRRNLKALLLKSEGVNIIQGRVVLNRKEKCT